jgi:hypothetical protein
VAPTARLSDGPIREITVGSGDQDGV